MKRLIGLASVFLLVSCGFKPAVSWSKIDGPVNLVSQTPFNDVERELNSLIQQSLASFDEIPEPDGPRRIELAPLETTTEVISVDSNGRPAEYRIQLTQDATFLIGDAEYAQQFSQQGEYVFDVRDILAYKQQLQQLELTLSKRLAQQIMFAFASRLNAPGVTDAN